MTDIHRINIGSPVSFGLSWPSINPMAAAAPKLVYHLTRSRFVADVKRHRQSLLAYEVAQAMLR
jgi:FAD-dependent urate hydroxylase